MSEKMYNKYNFHKHTFCEFLEVSSESVATLKVNYKSKSGSSYYFTEEGVYRVSNHWGRAANCRWRLISSKGKTNQISRIGFAKWSDFYPNNENEKLFFIIINWDTKEVSFQHKQSITYKNQVLRNASDTQKTIKKVKSILESDKLLRHYEYDDIDELRHKIITEMLEKQ